MKKIVITMLVLLSAAYAVGIGGGEVARKLNLRPSQIVPSADTLPVRNLIYLIGDGMGLSHVSMLMLEEGYGTTAFDRAQNIALITTYSANNRVTDSAAAGTALATGHKTGNGMLGVLPDSTAAESIMADAIRAGMPTGVVVTSTLQHATPGAFYAHVPYRRQYQRISDQLAGSDLTVAFGGGLKYAETSEREDGVPGIERLRDRGFRVLTDPSQLDTLSRGPVMGFFADGHLPKMSEGRGDYLERAIRKALEILSREAGERDRGFILMVEGSQIDLRAHDNDADDVERPVSQSQEGMPVYNIDVAAGTTVLSRELTRGNNIGDGFRRPASWDARGRYGRSRNGRSFDSFGRCRFRARGGRDRVPFQHRRTYGGDGARLSVRDRRRTD